MAHKQYKYHLKRRYGMSLDGYQYMYNKQKGECLICGSFQKELNVDHDHVTQDVRGLLCPNCNLGLGHFKDNPILLIKAAKYLKESKAVKELYDLIYL